MRIVDRTESGRVNTLEVIYADTSALLHGTEVRRFLAWPPGGYLPGGLFYFAQTSDSTLEIRGGGYGHGVGMCQWGAMNMSQNGFKYYHILSKYYPGTVLKRKY